MDMNSQNNSLAAIKGMAREHLSGNYGSTVRAYIWMNMILVFITWLSMSVLEGLGSRFFSVIFYVLYLLIGGIFSAGSAFLYLNLTSSREVFPGMVFYCFKYHTDKAVIICLYKGALELGVSLLFIVTYVMYMADHDAVYLIPMAIGTVIMIGGLLLVSAIYLPAYYVIHDFPDYSAVDIIKLCPVIVRGKVFSIILIYLQMIPLKLLSVVSFGIGAPWAESYISAILAEFYLDLMKSGRVPETTSA